MTTRVTIVNHGPFDPVRVEVQGRDPETGRFVAVSERTIEPHRVGEFLVYRGQSLQVIEASAAAAPFDGLEA